MRLRLLLFGRDVLELTATRHDNEEDDPSADLLGFGFAAGSTLITERADLDDDPPDDRR